jgi:hypothetical protein
MSNVSGHLQVQGPKGARRWDAFWRDAQGKKHRKTLGPAHIKDSGTRTPRGAIIWRAATGPKPSSAHLTPKDATALLDELLADARRAPVDPRRSRRSATRGASGSATSSFDRHRKPSTVRDYASQTRRYLLDEFGADLPLSELTTERIEEWQQEMFERGHLARRTIQKASACTRSSSERRRSAGSNATQPKTPTGSR